jgi:hypothetical protein
VSVIPRPFFDRPFQTDPLFWFGIVGGLVIGIAHGSRAGLGPGEFAYQLFTGAFFFTWWVAGLLLSTIRHHVRRRRAIKQQEDEVSST